MPDIDYQKNLIIEDKYDNYLPLYVVNLDFNIEEPTIYREVFEKLRKADEKTKFNIILNTNGGYISTTIQLIDAFRSTKGQTKAIIYRALSAGALIALSCKEINVRPHATMMFHNIWWDFEGDINKGKWRFDHAKKEAERLFSDICKGFLTEKEIFDIINHGIEIWLTEEEIKERLKNRKEN